MSSEFRVQSSEFRVQSSEFGVRSSEFGVQRDTVMDPGPPLTILNSDSFSWVSISRR